MRSCPKKPNERVDMSKMKGRVEGDRRHVENSPLSEIGGRRGAKEPFGNVGRKRLGIQLDSTNDLLFVCYVYCLFLASALSMLYCGMEKGVD